MICDHFKTTKVDRRREHSFCWAPLYLFIAINLLKEYIQTLADRSNNDSINASALIIQPRTIVFINWSAFSKHIKKFEEFVPETTMWLV